MNICWFAAVILFLTILHCDAGGPSKVDNLKESLKKFAMYGCHLEEMMQLSDKEMLTLPGRMMKPIATAACKLAKSAGGLASKGKGALSGLKERAGGLLSRIRSRKQNREIVEEGGMEDAALEDQAGPEQQESAVGQPGGPEI